MSNEEKIREIANRLADIPEHKMCIECKSYLSDDDNSTLYDLDREFNTLLGSLDELHYYYVEVTYADKERYPDSVFYLGTHPSLCCMGYEFPYATEEEAKESIEKHPDIGKDKNYIVEIKKK